MRLSFDVEQFSEAVDKALALPCTDNKQKEAMVPYIMPTCLALLQQAQGDAAPTSQSEATARIIAIVGTAFTLGFDAGRVYESKEVKRVELAN